MKKNKQLLSLIISFVMIFCLPRTVSAEYIETTDIENPISCDTLVFELPSSASYSTTSVSRSIDSFVVECGLYRRVGDRFDWFFNVDCTSSVVNKPTLIVTAQVQASFTDGSTFVPYGEPIDITIDSNLDYGIDYLWSTDARTGYYRFYFELRDISNGCTDYNNTRYRIFNRTGHEWTYEFYATGKVLPEPRADWIKNPTYDRSNIPPYREYYFSTYTARTGITLDESKYQVHHIQPLEFYGSNDYTNMIHLPVSLHTQISGWYNGY